jgi:shikimate kinase
MIPPFASNSRRFHGPGLVLVGYRGTGKSTVGRLLADTLGRPFIDADVQLESRAGRTIASIFADSGEVVFRNWEERIIAEITSTGTNAILATGGGAVLREVNRVRLREFGFIVWLKASAEILAARLTAAPGALSDRPALTSAGTLGEISRVLESRLPLYHDLADVAVDTEGCSPSQVADAIRDILRDRSIV